MSRWVVFISMAVAALVLSGSAAADHWERSFDVTGKPSVRVRTDDGRIHVVPGTSRRVEVTVETHGWDIGRQVKVRARQQGRHVEIEALLPMIDWSFGSPSRSLSVEVRVPRSTDLELSSGDGAITVEAIHGRLHVDTGDGRIEIDRVVGDLSLASADGAILVGGADGSVRCRTSDGRISLQGRFDALNIETGDGRVHAMAESGSKITDGWSITTGDGPMTIGLPADLAADLDAETGDGSIDIDFPVTIEGRYGRHHLHGHVNGGGPTLHIRSGDGSIRIERS